MGKESEKRYKDVKRPTITLTIEEHKAIEHFRIDLDMKIGEFIREAALYCVRNNIIFLSF